MSVNVDTLLPSGTFPRRSLPPLDSDEGAAPDEYTSGVLISPFAGLPIYEGTIEEDFVGSISTGNDVIQYYARYGRPSFAALMLVAVPQVHWPACSSEFNLARGLRSPAASRSHHAAVNT